jgi:hypothetical protein
MSYLTGPVNALQDFNVEYNGFLLGPGTNYNISAEVLWNFLDIGALKTMDQARDWADGSWSGPDFSDVLLPQMAVSVSSGDPVVFAAAQAAIRSAFGPQLSALPLWVKIPGFAALGIPAKVNQRAIPIDNTWGSFAVAALQFRCPDPAWQSVPRSLSLASSSSSGSGLLFPMFGQGTGTAANAAADFGSTAAATSSGILTNAGNSPAWPVVVISGPVTNFTINIDGNLVTWTDTIPAGQTLTIDYSTGLATLTGGIDRTYSLSSRAFSAVPAASGVVPGQSTVFFTATTGSAMVTIADVSR